MRSTVCLMAALALLPAAAPVGAKATSKPAAFELNHTSWTLVTKKGTRLRESVDADGNYVTETSAGKQIDHGTAVVKDGKACFTSAVDKSGEDCWTTSPVAIGHTMKSTNEKGQTIHVTRVAYMPMKAR